VRRELGTGPGGGQGRGGGLTSAADAVRRRSRVGAEKDEARAGGSNVGLGLLLVRALADLLEIETRLSPDKTFRITLSGPVAD